MAAFAYARGPCKHVDDDGKLCICAIFMPADESKPNSGLCQDCFDDANSHPMMRKDTSTLQMLPLVEPAAVPAPASSSGSSSSSSSSGQTPQPVQMIRDPRYQAIRTPEGLTLYMGLGPNPTLLSEESVPMVPAPLSSRAAIPTFQRQPERNNTFG